MIICKTIRAIAAGFITFLAVSQSCYAFNVYADFNGDMLHDSTFDVSPGSSITVGIYASQTATEVATNGGLNGFGVDLTTGGLSVLDDNLDNVILDSQWNFATSKNINDPAIASVRAVGNTLTPGGFEDLIVHLFDINLDVPAAVGESYVLSLADIPGDSFVSNNAFIYDDFVVFADSTVSAVPIPGAVWLMFTGMVTLIGMGRARRTSSMS